MINEAKINNEIRLEILIRFNFIVITHVQVQSNEMVMAFGQ